MAQSVADRPGVRTRVVTAGGVPTKVLTAGSGRPVVLLHGSGPGVSAEANWSGLIPELARDFQVVAPDIAGFGASVGPEGTAYGIKLWVRQLVELLDALELPSATLLGNSFGGGLSLAAALRHPDRVDGLVLLGTPVGTFEMTEGLRSGWHYEPDEAEMRRILTLFPHEPALVTDAMVRSRYEASARPGAQEAFRRLIPEPGPAGTPVRGVQEESLRTIGQPTLILHGREDRVIPVELAWRAARNLPNADLKVFAQCGHWVQLERPDGFLREVRAFLGGL
ncbi:alpha/beta fold hydrolase [Actinomadura rupiterrae]|uniref:alpha/beta fold hydrolase n=1 Tax=Actinomadura rupiterrae TaxID=559627 RepID=UPI0020A5B63E|nr:alpha/beta hydrolase [Actinomadura rupiterrae]MCP2338679.1 2-hydroxy-6-oxo-octa-2,4-dienoate hydrolase [Actinomadura rupiterrae]